MPEPFKHKLSQDLVRNMADCFEHPGFDKQGFIERACSDLDELELKARSEHIVLAMHEYLPDDFSLASEVLLASLRPMKAPDTVSKDDAHTTMLADWSIMPMADYVGIYGQAHFDLAIDVLFEMTKRFSSEFAIRHFLVQQQERTLKALALRLNDESEHVRRLISEGTRPRLPWGMQLRAFVKNPSPLLPLLEALKDDSSEYVRRSVANNLNDIAKDHPELVVQIGEKWLQDANENRTRLVRHALRTLFKKGEPEALALFGFHPPKLGDVHLRLPKTHVSFGGELYFSVQIRSESMNSEPQKIMLDYVVYHQKSNGQLSPKVFKWKVVDLKANETLELSKTHSFKAVTTRKYYCGEHKLALLVNGQETPAHSFSLV
ncbi:DNA alkylation repair protein [Ningiella sp. W23]|uniref:DNA alkylation repair protein n=1 Tax=Ningiella sp. W23 TaxID=3023715 RepID=UPI00375721F5